MSADNEWYYYTAYGNSYCEKSWSKYHNGWKREPLAINENTITETWVGTAPSAPSYSSSKGGRGGWSSMTESPPQAKKTKDWAGAQG